MFEVQDPESCYFILGWFQKKDELYSLDHYISKPAYS